jgi:hypothetical protein
MDKFKAEAIARARAQIAARIARFCRNLSREDFEALLDRMAGIQYKYESLEEIPEKKRRAPPPPRPSPER